MNGMIFRSSENGIASKRTQIPSILSIPIPEQSQKYAPLVKFNSVLATFKNENLRIFFVKFCKRSWTKQRYLPKFKQMKKADYKVWVTIFSNISSTFATCDLISFYFFNYRKLMLSAPMTSRGRRKTSR